jgi:hypothetical protein
MEHIHTFENFLFEDKAERITINAALWNGRTPETKNDSRETQYIFYSGDLLGGKYINFLGKPNNVLIVIEQPKNDDKLYIKVGGGSEDESGTRLYRRSIGDTIVATADELKADPAGFAKKIADLFINDKKYFDMNVMPFDRRAIFKMERDLDKPALELINYAIQNIK